jgi:hypothetical protein
VTKERRKNLTERAPMTRLSRESSFAVAPSREDKISGAAAQAIAPVLVIAEELAVKAGLVTEAEVVWAATAAVWVAEVEPVIVAARASSAVAAVAAAPSKGSIAAVAQRAAPASAVARAGQAVAAVVAAEVAVVAAEVVVVVDAAGKHQRSGNQ